MGNRNAQDSLPSTQIDTLGLDCPPSPITGVPTALSNSL